MTKIPLPPLPQFHTHGPVALNPEGIRARDLEVARVVLEAAAQACFPAYWADECADEIRKLKVSHD